MPNIKSDRHAISRTDDNVQKEYPCKHSLHGPNR